MAQPEAEMVGQPVGAGGTQPVIETPVPMKKELSKIELATKQSFARSATERLGEDGMVKANCWEKFLAGYCCNGKRVPCLAFWIFLILLLLLSVLGVGGGFKLDEGGGEVIASNIVQLQWAVRTLTEHGCEYRRGTAIDDFGMDFLPICQEGVDGGREVEEENDTPVDASQLNAQYSTLVMLMFEAIGTGCPGDDCDLGSESLLTEARLRAMKRFEDGMVNEEDYQGHHCLRTYSLDTDNHRCMPPMSFMNQVFFDPGTAVEETQNDFDAGFGNSFGKCFCGVEATACASCASVAAKQAAVDCMMQQDQSSFFRMRMLPPSLMGNTSGIRNVLTGIVDGFCSEMGGDACQFAAPMTTFLCASDGWAHNSDANRRPLQGEQLAALLESVCDSSNPSVSRIRSQNLPMGICDAPGGGTAASLDRTRLATSGTPFLQSMYMLGKPFRGKDGELYEDKDDDDVAAQYSRDLFMKYQELKREITMTDDGVRPMMFSPLTVLLDLQQLLIHDSALAVGSFVIVFLYMWFTTESFFLTGMGMIQVLFSLPPAFFVWKIINPDGVGPLQFLSLFMILGIGADDVFVLLDAWKQARFFLADKKDHPDYSLAAFSLGYSRALSAMLTTTATTGAAFLFGAFSPIPMVADFCVFAFLVVSFDFLWCITFFASALCIYEQFFEGKAFCCCGKAPPPGECAGPGCCWGCIRCCFVKTPCGKKRADAGDERALETFFAGPMFNFVDKRKFPLLGFWVFIACTFAVVAGTQLKTASKPADIGNEDHDFVRFVSIMREYFAFSEGQHVKVVWGLPEESPVESWISQNPYHPEVSFRSDYADLLLTREGQEQALELCRFPDGAGMRGESTSSMVAGSPATGLCQRNEQIWDEFKIYVPESEFCLIGRYCWIEWLQEYAEHHAGRSDSPVMSARSESQLTFPMNPGQVVPALVSQGWRDYLERRAEANARAGRPWDVALENERTGWIIDSGISPTNSEFIDDYNDGQYGLDVSQAKLKFAWASFNVTFRVRSPIDVNNDNWQMWEDKVAEKAGDTGALHITEMYSFMVLQNELLMAAVQGICTSLSVTCVILALVTFNWMLALIGFFNICFITVIFLGIVPLFPWELGTNECIFLIAVVGLSVDYTVHLLHAYNEHQGSRSDKMQGAFSTMGISVLSGAMTTIGAGIMLFFCDMHFFKQYGQFIVFVIVVSLVMAVTCLPPIVLVLGPAGDQGDIAALYWIREKLTGRKKIANRSGSKDQGTE